MEQHRRPAGGDGRAQQQRPDAVDHRRRRRRRARAASPRPRPLRRGPLDQRRCRADGPDRPGRRGFHAALPDRLRDRRGRSGVRSGGPGCGGMVAVARRRAARHRGERSRLGHPARRAAGSRSAGGRGVAGAGGRSGLGAGQPGAGLHRAGAGRAARHLAVGCRRRPAPRRSGGPIRRRKRGCRKTPWSYPNRCPGRRSTPRRSRLVRAAPERATGCRLSRGGLGAWRAGRRRRGRTGGRISRCCSTTATPC